MVLMAFFITALFLIMTAGVSVMSGGLNVEIARLLRGLFLVYDRDVAIIIRLRFPRIVISILGGALLAMSGIALQAVMRNPLADPGIIGVNAGAAFASTLIFVFFPRLASVAPVFAFLGGGAAFMMVFFLSQGAQMSPVRMILTGIAVSALFTGLSGALQSATGMTYTGAASMINANVSQKTWADAGNMFVYFVPALILGIVLCGRMNLLALSDETMWSIGVNAGRIRVVVSVVAVLMASIVTSIAGSISFLALIVPHIARLLVGSDHKKLLPFGALLGSTVFLAADTLGRTIAYPYEISPAVIMSIVGGPLFILLIRRNGEVYGS